MAWNSIVKKRESFQTAWEEQRAEEMSWRKEGRGRLEPTKQPPLDTVCSEIVNMY